MTIKFNYQLKSLSVRALHWGVAVLMSAALVTGYVAFDFTWVANGFLGRDLLFIIHRSAGLLVAILFLSWLVLRLRQHWQKGPDTLWRFFVGLNHTALALLGFAIPITAWIGRGAGGRSEEMFSILPIYNLVSISDVPLAYIMLELHKSLIPWFLVLLFAHIAATLFHTFHVRDNLFSSMLAARLHQGKK